MYHLVQYEWTGFFASFWCVQMNEFISDDHIEK